MNALLALVMVSLFVAPTIYHLVSDFRTRKTRDLSIIPHRWRHLAGAMLRLAAIAGAFALNTLHELPLVTWVPYAVVAGVSALIIAVSATDRRLYIDADTGLITWQKITLPWWRPGLKIAYIDHVSPLSYEDDHYLSLFGIAKLERHWTTSYNGSVSSSGHYRKKTLQRLVTTVNEYRRAFLAHDEASARARRRAFREQREAKLAPRRRSKADRAAAWKARVIAKEQARERKSAERKARKEAKRRAKMDAKFA